MPVHLIANLSWQSDYWSECRFKTGEELYSSLRAVTSLGFMRFDDFSEEASNISAPLEMCVRWMHIDRLEIDRLRYFAGRKMIRKYIYIGDNEAKAILTDAITAHADAPDTRAKLAKIAGLVWGEDAAVQIWSGLRGDCKLGLGPSIENLLF